MTPFERRLVAALIVLFLILLPTALFLHHTHSVHLKVVHSDAR